MPAELDVVQAFGLQRYLEPSSAIINSIGGTVKVLALYITMYNHI